MPIIIPYDEIEQNTDDWHTLRLGIPTSSGYSRILKINGERSGSWDGYITELVTERISGQANTFESWDMKLGHEQEPHARWLYSQMNQVEVVQVAFIYKDDTRRTGASTDGLIGDVGIFEAKGGKGETHFQRLKDYNIDPEKFNKTFTNKHFQQLQGELYVAEREWVDLFASFPGMRPIEIRVYRDEKWISKLHESLSIFYEDLECAFEFARAA